MRVMQSFIYIQRYVYATERLLPPPPLFHTSRWYMAPENAARPAEALRAFAMLPLFFTQHENMKRPPPLMNSRDNTNGTVRCCMTMSMRHYRDA